jgi:hypothetical protein
MSAAKYYSLSGNTLRTESTVYVRVFGGTEEDILALDISKMFRCDSLFALDLVFTHCFPQRTWL